MSAVACARHPGRHGAGVLGPEFEGRRFAEERFAWCEIRGCNGRVVRTNSFADFPDGSRFVTVLDADGYQLGWWPSELWGDPGVAQDAMADLWSVASDAVTAYDDEYGVELVFELEGGALRAAPDGEYVRFVDEDGDGVDGGSAYWTADEWVEDPELVMGAILGCACALGGDC